ncbi:RNA polymerase sigma factor [Spirosoma areae]
MANRTIIDGGYALIARLRDSDATAFTFIYKTYWHEMFLVAYQKLNDKESAEELVQDIFTRLWKNRVTTEINNLEYYLFSSVRYEVINCIRSRRRRDEYAIYFYSYSNVCGFTTEETIAFNELVKLIETAINRLSKKTQAVFRMSRFENLTISQIARCLFLSEKAVEYHLSKALKYLRSYIVAYSSIGIASTGSIGQRLVCN